MEWIKQMLSEKGEPSSKRCAGFFVIVIVMFCTLGMVLEKYDSVKELLEVEFISACSLIGLGTVATMFNKQPGDE